MSKTKLQQILNVKKDKEFVTDDEIKQIKIYFAQRLQDLGKRLKFRQRVIATGLVFFRRFYVKNNFAHYDPMLFVPACLYVATKVEECPAQVKVIITQMKTLEPSFSYTPQDILESEFYVLEELEFQLVVYHPYRPMTQFIADIGVENVLLQTAWSILNDSYRTDICVLYPPYLIALTCIYMASVLLPCDLKQWFAELSVDMKEIAEITSELVDLYDIWGRIDGSDMEKILQKLPKFKRR